MPVEQRPQDNSNGSLPYLFAPAGDVSKSAPLVLFLHGARDSLRDASRTRTRFCSSVMQSICEMMSKIIKITLHTSQNRTFSLINVRLSPGNQNLLYW
jgi:hypothetical protein